MALGKTDKVNSQLSKGIFLANILKSMSAAGFVDFGVNSKDKVGSECSVLLIQGVDNKGTRSIDMGEIGQPNLALMEPKSDCGLSILGVSMVEEAAFPKVVSGKEESLADCNPLFTIIPSGMALSMEAHNDPEIELSNLGIWLGKQHLDLNFCGISYSVEVLNGHKKLMPKGVFQRHSLDVTDILHPDGQNLLAFPVHLPDHPGRIPHKGEHGGDHEIGKDVATQYVLGWDWMAPKRDRNTSIWDEVSVSITRRVKIIDPHLVSSFFDDYKRVYLHATTELENRSAWLLSVL
ncbi:hypothetical protein CMV_009871 [Castanea mollissima]|uniref:Beta-mannosidase-like galactose-binding domain-containing protein n=1 Tax=Castanea mollissima TaxID=60419 RepID=A0A8J4RK00_9ROSI|nr:hypothetical protein CMV_009871 [Castanea mollissima]